MKKSVKITIIIFVCLVIGGLGSIFLLPSKFHSGECVQAEDGYIWRVNNYRMGKYYLMSWEENGWGNEIEQKKVILERKDLNDVLVYHQVSCPEYSLR